MKKLSSRMRTLMDWVRRGIRVQKSTEYVYLNSEFRNDEPLERELSTLFIGWDKMPIAERQMELKHLFRYVSAHPVDYAGEPPADVYTPVYNLWYAIRHCPRCQTMVNMIINRKGDVWLKEEKERFFSKEVAELLQDVPNNKLKAIKQKVSDLREAGTYCDGFRDWWMTHPVKVFWNSELIAETWCHQVGACARACGKIEWKFYKGWSEMMATQGKAGWPSFEVDKSITEQTYMEII